MVASAIVGAAVVTTGATLYASNQASKAGKSAANAAAAAQREALDRQEELQEPFRQAGITAQNKILTVLGLEGGDTASPEFGKYARDFSMADFEADPGYGFRIKEGMKALESSAAARGGLLSGSTLKGIQRFGQDTASNEYINAFNRYQTNRSNQLNPLQSLYTGGQSSTNLLSNAAAQTGQGVGSAMLAGGQARASGYTGMASALNQGLSTGVNAYLQAPLYNAMAQYYQRPNYGLVSGANVGGPGGL